MTEFIETASITFVTSLYNIYGDTQPVAERDLEWRISHFKELAATGVPLCVYMCVEYAERFSHEFAEHTNVVIIATMPLQSTQFAKELATRTGAGASVLLPHSRNPAKDTIEYMILMNAKTEFVADAIHRNPWNTTHFAWIDFSIFYIFTGRAQIADYLRQIVAKTPLAAEFIAFPGCWCKLPNMEDRDAYLERIYWRFCGGFFVGDAGSVRNFCERSVSEFPRFLDTFGNRMVWEVNYWAWLEAEVEVEAESDAEPKFKIDNIFAPLWYAADHNDSIVKLPDECFRVFVDMFDPWSKKCLAEMRGFTKKSYANYPKIGDYEIGSAAYLFHNGKHHLNTRYVNYWLTPEGTYCIRHPTSCIVSKNLYCELSDDDLIPKTPFVFMTNPDMPSDTSRFDGLEDIRLYSDSDIRYIATSINYSQTGRNRIIAGKYDIVSGAMTESAIIHPPTDTGCEKNWIPVTNSAGEQRVIYKWYPMEIGEIVEIVNANANNNSKRLEIVQRYDITNPMFKHVRGSTIFIDYIDKGSSGLIVAVVHYSKEGSPRNYYHMLVLLEKETLRPVKCTDAFFFEKVGIEFCIGMTDRGDDFVFWTSKFDREGAMITIPKNTFEWKEI